MLSPSPRPCHFLAVNVSFVGWIAQHCERQCGQFTEMGVYHFDK